MAKIHAPHREIAPEKSPRQDARKKIRMVAPNLSFATNRARMRARECLLGLLRGMRDADRSDHLSFATALADDFSPVMDLTLLQDLPSDCWKGIGAEARRLLLSEMALTTISEIVKGSHEKMELIDYAYNFLLRQRGHKEALLLKKAMDRNFTSDEIMEIRASLLGQQAGD